MSQHLEDRVLTDLAFDLLDAKEAAAAKRHLQGCKACKARQKVLRATIGQLDATNADFKASEELIARTLRATRGETEVVEKAVSTSASVAKPKKQKRPPPAPITMVPPPAVTEEPPVILDLPPRRDVLDMSRFFWLSAAAALVIAGLVIVSTFTQKPKSEVAMTGRAEQANDLKKADDALVVASVPASYAATETAVEKRMSEVPSPVIAGGRAAPPLPEAKKLPAETMQLALADARADLQAGRDKDSDGLLAEKERSVSTVAPRPVSAPSAPLELAAADAPRARSLIAAPPAKAEAGAMTRGSIAAKSAAPATTAPVIASAPKNEQLAAAFGGGVAAMPPGQSRAAPADGFRRANSDEDFTFTLQTVSFVLPITSGTWVLQQNVRVRASLSDDEARMDVSNHGALPVLFQLLERRGTNVLQQFSLDAGAATNFIQRTR